MTARKGVDLGINLDAIVSTGSYTDKLNGAPSEEEEGPWGQITRGHATFLRATTAEGRTMHLMYNCMESDWASEKDSPHRLRVLFGHGNDLVWLTITVAQDEAAIRFLAVLAMALQHQTLKSIRPDRERIADVTIELAPLGYHPFAEQVEGQGRRKGKS